MEGTRTALDLRRFADRANIFFPGFYAWLLTVGQPAALGGVSWLTRVLAGIGLLSLTVGPLFFSERPRVARILGIYAFIGCSVFTWWLLGPIVSPDRLDPTRATLGALGWLLYAFGWGRMRGRGRVPEEDPNVLPGDTLAARSRLPRAAFAVAAVSFVGALIPVVIAWRVERPDHASFAHAITLAAGTGVLSVGATLALGLEQPRLARSATSRLNSAAAALGALAVLGVLAIVWLFLD